MTTLKDNSQRARETVFMLTISLVLYCMGLLYEFYKYSVLNSFTEESDPDKLTLIESSDFLFYSTHLLVMVLSSVFFIRWFRRAYHNLHMNGRNRLSFTEGWAVGCWFMPFVNIIRPFQIMREIWDETQENIRGKTETKNSVMIGWWWTMWIVSLAGDRISFKLTRKAESLEQLADLAMVDVFVNALNIVALVMIIRIVKQTHSFEKLWADSIDDLATEIALSDKGDDAVLPENPGLAY